MISVFLAGEGSTELGGWANRPPYRTATPGMLETLAERVVPEGWVVGDALCWKNIRKYRAGQHLDVEARNVLGVALQAKDASCGVLLSCRDRDRDTERERSIKDAPVRAREMFPIEIVGGVAVDAIEAWTLALLGDRQSHRHARPGELGHSTTVGFDVDELESPSLVEWLRSAKAAL